MKNFITLTFILLGYLIYAQQPNDCMNYIQVCGSQSIALDVSGPGNMEELSGKGCGTALYDTYEHNSLWLRIIIEEAGTLGFTLTPASNNISEDYDFWVFGSNVDCATLPHSIRCSTTNPNEANQGNNLTGMNGNESDYQEGPGNLGNSFVRWLDVEVGETYFIVLDRPIGNSSFTLDWTGTAVLVNPLNNVQINNLSPLNLCDSDENGLENYDLSLLNNQIVTDLTGLEITYYDNATDVFTGSNGLDSSSNLSSGTYWYRVENIATGCFVYKSFSIEVKSLDLKKPIVAVCDRDNDLMEVIDLTSYNLYEDPITDTYFYLNENDANDGSPNYIQDPNNYVINTNDVVIYARVETTDCYGKTELKFNLIPQPQINSKQSEFCISQINNGINVNNYTTDFVQNSNQSIAYYLNQTNLDNNSPINGLLNLGLGTHAIIVEITENGCSNYTTWSITVIENFDIGQDESIELCAEEFPYTIEFNEPFEAYSWSDGSISPNLEVSAYGDYTLTVTNSLGCQGVKTYSITEKDPPMIKEIIINQPNELVIITDNPNSDLLYQLNNGPWQPNNTFHQPINGVYDIKVKFSTGCIAEDSGIALSKVYNFITPNSDGMNDTFNLSGLRVGDKEVDLEIYNRYGKKIFSASSKEDFIWDGTINGRLAPTGNYYYILRFDEDHVYTGHLTVKLN